eukprot:7864752-Pyramimonas_sp.AAC.1
MGQLVPCRLTSRRGVRGRSSRCSRRSPTTQRACPRQPPPLKPAWPSAWPPHPPPRRSPRWPQLPAGRMDIILSTYALKS